MDICNGNGSDREYFIFDPPHMRVLIIGSFNSLVFKIDFSSIDSTTRFIYQSTFVHVIKYQEMESGGSG